MAGGCLESHGQCCWKEPEKVNPTSHGYGARITQNTFFFFSFSKCWWYSQSECTFFVPWACSLAVFLQRSQGWGALWAIYIQFFLALKRPHHGMLQMKGYLCARKQHHHSSRQEPSDDDRRSEECDEMRKYWVARGLSTWLALFMPSCRQPGKGQLQKGADTAHRVIFSAAGSTRSD